MGLLFIHAHLVSESCNSALCTAAVKAARSLAKIKSIPV